MVPDSNQNNQNAYPQMSQYHMASGNHFGNPMMGMMNGMGGLQPADRHNPYSDSLERQATPKLSADLIPTAIVIKNIPFNVRKETLAAIMDELNLPAPYAFNYHFDNGIFRGLAFANFSNPEDTSVVIEMLNGYEVSGRKLRVEYKKMLPEAERERIEREKREKRGQLEEQHQPIKGLSQPQGGPMHMAASAHSSAANSRVEALRKFSGLVATLVLVPLILLGFLRVPRLSSPPPFAATRFFACFISLTCDSFCLRTTASFPLFLLTL
jgi:RNA recognition motif-containing protein